MSAKKIQSHASVSKGEVLTALYSQLKIHDALGIHAYPSGGELDRFFQLTDDKKGGLEALLTPHGKTGIEPGTGEQKDQVIQRLNFLSQEIAECRLCSLFHDKRGSIFGQGQPGIALMIVGDWSIQNPEIEFSQNIIFGQDEDAILWKMMAAIGLQTEDVFVTDCLKCCPNHEVKPDKSCEKRCFSYLEREIALVRPRIICAMGEVAARIITGSNEPLARMRGRFARYRYGAGQEIYVMPTYHPRFLLQHQEMKKATWLDLQAIQKKLTEK